MFRLIAGAICHPLLWCCLAAAQDSRAAAAPQADGKAPTKPSESAAGRVEERMPVYYLVDEEGNLQAVPGGWTLKDFEELWKLKERLEQPDQRPRYVLQRMSATGTARTNDAELTIEFRVLVRDDDWVRVPLRLDRAILREPAEYKGPGKGFVDLEDGGEGHVGWIRGQSEQPHQLTLKLLVPLASVGDETRLKLLAPRATVSELTLEVPIARAVGEVSDGARLEPPLAKNGATRFTARGLGGDFQLTWRKADGRSANVPAMLEVEGTILAQVGNLSVDTEATLSVHGYGAPFDRFRVRLPQGAKLVPGSPSGYTVTEVKPEDPAALEKNLVEVRLAQKASGPVEVRLATSRPHKLAKQNEWLELAGFEVIEAARQSGQIAIATVGQWQVQWRGSHGIRQVAVDQLPDPLRHKDAVAGFAYFAPPSLTARLVPRVTRISVEPTYLLLVDADQVRLEARLKYRVRGAKAFELDVGLPGWEFDEVGPENLVAVDRVKVNNSNMFSIPLLTPSTGQIELLIRAHWPIPEGANSLELPLPQPQANSSGPAAVVVAPADNVELTNESMAGLIKQQVDPQMRPPERPQDKLLFYRGEPTEDRVAFDFRVHSQYLAVEVTSQLNLEEQACHVEQKLVYTIQYEPADHFTIDVPRSLAKSDQLELLHDGQPLPAALPENADQEHSTGPLRVPIPLPEACIGSWELVVRYPLPLKKLVADNRLLVDVPLVMPSEGEGELSGNKLYVTAAPGIKVEPPQAPWTALQGDAPRPGEPYTLQLTSEQRTDKIALAVELEQGDGSGEGATVVERAWIRTWLTRSVRQDRAVFRFTSERKNLELTIPAGAALGQVDTWWIKKSGDELIYESVVGESSKDGRLVIPLSNDAKRRPYVLEVRYHFPQQRPRPGHVSLQIPRLGDNVWVRRMYWQLVLPPNEHLITAAKGFTNEFAWGWDGYFFGRKPLLDQAELESWVGAPREKAGAPHEKHVPGGVNCYLFSTMGEVERCELRTARLSWIVLIAAGAALVVGLLLIYVPVSRHPGTLFGVAVLLLCVGVLYPDPTLLFSQAASLGLALSLVAGLLERGVARRRRGTAFPEPPSSKLEKGSTEIQHRPPEADSQSSTETAPAIEPPPNPNANA